MAGLELGWRVVAAELLAWLVVVIALVLSYRAEQDLGQSLPMFRGWAAYVWPFSVDIADVMLLVLFIEYRRLSLSTWKVGVGLLACTAVMIAANIRSAWPDPTAVAMQAWAPAIALWIWHTLASGRRPRGAPLDLGAVWGRMSALGRGERSGRTAIGASERSTGGTASARNGSGQALGKRSTDRGRERSVSVRRALGSSARNGDGRARAFEVIAQARRDGERLTGEALGKRIGLSAPSGRRLLAEYNATSSNGHQDG